MLVLIKILHWILFLIIYRYLHAITTIVITIISIIIIIVQIYWPGGGLSLPPPTTFLNVRTIIVNTIISIIIITINTIVGCFWRGGGLSFPVSMWPAAALCRTHNRRRFYFYKRVYGAKLLCTFVQG